MRRGYAGKADCGGPSGSFTEIGTTLFTRKGDVVTMQIHAIDLVPNTAYEVYLFEADPTPGTCGASYKTKAKSNKKGYLSKKYSHRVTGDTPYFFSDLYGASTNNDSVSVDLP